MTGIAAEPRVIADRPPQWCWSRLMSFTEGTLSFSMPRGRVNLPVPYTVARRRIVIGLAPINTIGWQADGLETTLEVTAVEQGRRWFVRATGLAHRCPGDERDVRLLASPHDRPRLAFDPAPDVLVLSTTRVSGSFEESAVDPYLWTSRR